MIIKKLLDEAKKKATCTKHSISAVIESINPQISVKDYAVGWNGPDEVHECVRKNLIQENTMILCAEQYMQK